MARRPRKMKFANAAAFLQAVRQVGGVSAARAMRRRLSKELIASGAVEVRDLGLMMVAEGHKWLGYEILSDRTDVLEALTRTQVEALGDGLSDWGGIDAYSVLLAGPAWKCGVLSNNDMLRWTRSDSFWRRRAALVATVAWNARSRGGTGDTTRTLMVCEQLVNDRHEMVVKALSWALRALVPWDRPAVHAFIAAHESVLAARVKREVRNKLDTGRKSGKKSCPSASQAWRSSSTRR